MTDINIPRQRYNKSMNRGLRPYLLVLLFTGLALVLNQINRQLFPEYKNIDNLKVTVM